MTKKKNRANHSQPLGGERANVSAGAAAAEMTEAQPNVGFKTSERTSDGSPDSPDLSTSSSDNSSGLFIQGACIAGLSVVLTYLGDVVFGNVLAVAGPLVQYQNPIFAALLLGLLLHPTTDRVQAYLNKRRFFAAFDGFCGRHRYGPGQRALSAAIVVSAFLFFVTLVLGFLSIGLVLEGASAARDVAGLPSRAEELWTEYVVEGGAARRFPALAGASDWLRENAAATVQPRIEAAKEDAAVALDAVQKSVEEVVEILRSYGIETDSLPDSSALISGQLSAAQAFIGSFIGIIWKACKDMAHSPEEAWAALQDIWAQYGDRAVDQAVEVKASVQEISWVASYGTGAAGATARFARSFVGAFGSILTYVWRSFVSALLFFVILFKLLQAERSWLEVAFANFMPGVIPAQSQEDLVMQVHAFSTTFFRCLGVKFVCMYTASFGSWLLFQVPFPYTMSLFFALVHTITPINATGRGVILVLCSLYLIYKIPDSRAADASHWLHQIAQLLSDALVGAIGWLAEDGVFQSYARRMASPDVLVAMAFVFAASSAQAWASVAADSYAPEMPFMDYVTFGGALLTVTSWLSTDEYGRKESGGGEEAATSVSIVSPWALTASLILFAVARTNPTTTRKVLFGI